MKDRASAAQWAWQQMQNPDALILDTETTGLGSEAEICQIAAIDLRGQVLINTLVRPVGSIPEDATAIHGISLKTVAEAITFKDLAQDVRSTLEGRTVLIYNRDYDHRLLRQSARLCGLDPQIAVPSSARFEDVMIPYSAWVGERGQYKGYRWQKLPGGDHSALGDCRATRRVLFTMAGLGWLCDQSQG